MKNKLPKKYIELITYFIFGVLTTVVNYVAFWIFLKLFGEKLYLLNNALAWILAVAFAYVTNKLFVFESKSWDAKIVVKEIGGFLSARLFSLLVEEAGLLLFIEVFNFDRLSFELFGFEITGQLIIKLMLSVIVVILNYFFSKFIIFKKKK